MALWASYAHMMAFTNSVLRSGELANFCLVLFTVCYRPVSDFQQLSLDDVFRVDQLVLVRDVVFEQVVHLLDDLAELGLFLVL
jgi:hypothetical protein